MGIGGAGEGEEVLFLLAGDGFFDFGHCGGGEREDLVEGVWWLIVGIVTEYLGEVGFGGVRSFGA